MAEVKISDAEWDVMEIVWQKRQITSGEVIGALVQVKDWHHRTIRTLLGRLVDKGVLSAEADGNRYVYRATLSRTQCVRQASRSFVEKIFGGDVGSLLAHFVRDHRVSHEELTQLRELLKEQLDDK